MAGAGGYDVRFLEHYLLRLIYPGSLTRGMQIAIGAFVLAVNALIYAHLLRRTWAKQAARLPPRVALESRLPIAHLCAAHSICYHSGGESRQCRRYRSTLESTAPSRRLSIATAGHTGW